MDNNIEALSNNGYENTLEEKGREALDNHFDMRQGKAIQDYINREEMMSLSLQRSTRVALDEKIRVLLAFLHISRIGARDRRYPNRHRRVHWTVSCEEGDPGQSFRDEEEVRDDRREQEDRARDKTTSAGDNFHALSDGEESESDTGLCGTRPMTMLNMKQ